MQELSGIEPYEIHGFESPGEYERFNRWLDALIVAGSCIEKSCAEVRDDEKYVRREIAFSSGAVWRLEPPDFPFRGSWQPLK
jgi:hypothetical protein